MAFGENATSEAFNRALGSVQENTDWLSRSVLSEIAIPTIVNVTTDIDPATFEIYVDTPGTNQAIRALVGLGGNTAAVLATGFSVLDQDFNEIDSAGTTCVVVPNGVKTDTIANGGQTLGAYENRQIHAAANITALTRHTVTCATATWNQEPGIAPIIRPVCPGDIAVIAGNDVANDTNAGTLDWEVHKVLSTTEIELRCLQDPSRSLDVTVGTAGTVTINSNGRFWVSPVVQLNYDPSLIAGVTTVYLVFGISKQPICSAVTGVGLPTSMCFPLEADSLTKIKIRAAEEEGGAFAALLTHLATCGLDDAYDLNFAFPLLPTAGGGRTILADTGSVRIQATNSVPVNDYNTLLEIDSSLVSSKNGYVGITNTSSIGNSLPFAGMLTLERCFIDNLSLVAIAITKKPAGPADEIIYSIGVDLSNIIPWATIAHITGGLVAEQGFYLVIDVDDVNDTLTLQNLDGTVAAFTNEAAFIQIYDISIWTNSQTATGMVLGGAEHVHQTYTSTLSATNYRSIKCKAGGYHFYAISTAETGLPNVVDTEDEVFSVDYTGNLRLNGSIIDTDSTLTGLIRSLDLHFGAQQTKWLSFRNINEYTALTLDAGASGAGEARYVTCDVASSGTEAGGPNKHSIFKINNITNAGDMRLTVQALTTGYEQIGTTAWELLNVANVSNKLEWDWVGAADKTFFQVDHTAANNVKYSFGWYDKDLDAAVPTVFPNIVSIGLGSSTNSRVNCTYDSLVAGAYSSQTFTPMYRSFGFGVDNRAIGIGHATANHTPGDCTSLVVGETGNIMLGGGYRRFLCCQDTLGTISSAFDFWPITDPIGPGPTYFTASQIQGGGLSGTTGACANNRINTMVGLTDNDTIITATGAFRHARNGDAIWNITRNTGSIISNWIDINTVDISPAIAGQVATDTFYGPSPNWFVDDPAPISVGYVVTLNTASPADGPLGYQLDYADSAIVGKGPIGIKCPDLETHDVLMGAPSVQTSGFAQVQKVAGVAISRGDICYLQTGVDVGKVHNVVTGVNPWVIGIALADSDAAFTYVDLALHMAPA